MRRLALVVLFLAVAVHAQRPEPKLTTSVAGGIGHGSGAHGPNEYLVVEPKAGSKIAGLAQMEKFYADLIYAFAQ